MNAITNYQRETHLMTVSRNAGKLFTEFVEEYINKCHRTDSYKQMYRIASNHITAFSCKANLAIYTDSLSEEALEEFVFYLQDDQQLMISTVKGIVERVKSMLQKASNAGYKVDGTFRDFNVRDEEIDSIFLSMTDIARRSAATNMFLANIPTFRIMLLTGHKTESAFFRYIRITREENAMVLSGNQFFN